MNEKRFILKRSNTTSSNYPLGERVYDTVLKTELHNSEIVEELNQLNDKVVELEEENKDLNKENNCLKRQVESLEEKNKQIISLMKQ